MWWWLACGDPPPPPVVSGLVTPEQLVALLAAPTPAGRVVNFWATWCGPCVEEMPRLQSWSQAHPEVDMLYVSVDLPKARDRFVLPFVERHGLSGAHHVQLDHPDPASAMPSVLPRWGGDIPLTLVVGPDGTERKRLVGAVADPEKELLP